MLMASLKKALMPRLLLLTPKAFGAFDLKDFCPINLVSGVYKIIVKVLANRMRWIVDKIISNP
jgi:hypothetical protein